MAGAGRNALLFGANGAIGQRIAAALGADGWNVVGSGRGAGNDSAPEWIAFDPFAADANPAAFDQAGPFGAVCWAQGANLNDSIFDVEAEAHLELYRANCLFNIVTLQLLLERGLIAEGARLVVISSIWQNLARQQKLSYTVSKAALAGFVRSAAVDLARRGIVINAILPGVLDTPMTRRTLLPQQVEKFEQATGFARLPAIGDVATLAAFLASDRNGGLTGQFLEADLGFSHARLV